MVNEFSYPEAPAVENINLPAPPFYKKGSGKDEKFLSDVSNYLGNVFLAFSDIGTAIRNGWLVQEARLVNLTVESIIAGSILTEVLYIGAEKSITLSGTTNQITIYDKQATPVLRVLSGKLGSGDTQYGVECKDAGGVVRFRVSDVTEMDGAIIKNATILGAKIIDAEITTSKIDDDAVNENKRIDQYSDSQSVNFGSLPDGGVGVSAKTITHNLGRAVQVTFDVSGFTFTAGYFVVFNITNQTSNVISYLVNGVNHTGGTFDPDNMTIIARYW